MSPRRCWPAALTPAGFDAATILAADADDQTDNCFARGQPPVRNAEGTTERRYPRAIDFPKEVVNVVIVILNADFETGGLYVLNIEYCYRC